MPNKGNTPETVYGGGRSPEVVNTVGFIAGWFPLKKKDTTLIIINQPFINLQGRQPWSTQRWEGEEGFPKGYIWASYNITFASIFREDPLVKVLLCIFKGLCCIPSWIFAFGQGNQRLLEESLCVGGSPRTAERPLWGSLNSQMRKATFVYLLL